MLVLGISCGPLHKGVELQNVLSNFQSKKNVRVAYGISEE